MDKNYRFYIAYGSNLNHEQFLHYRCNGAKLVMTGYLKNYELLFRGKNGNCFCTIEPNSAKKVPVAIYLLDNSSEKGFKHIEILDRYEGYPNHYYKKWFKKSQIEVFKKYMNISVKEAFAYIMQKKIGPLGYPNRSYFDIVQIGYQDSGLPEKYLFEALEKSIQ